MRWSSEFGTEHRCRPLCAFIPQTPVRASQSYIVVVVELSSSLPLVCSLAYYQPDAYVGERIISRELLHSPVLQAIKSM